MKLLIVAGGGGHFAPALAVIQKLPKTVEVMVAGRKYAFEADKALSLEYQTCHKLGIKFASITTGRLQRDFSRHSLNMFVKMPIGFLQSVKTLKDFKPDIILSFGGYVSLPVCLAARFLNIPIIIHEQTFGAGLANKIVGKFAQKILISWEQSKKFFPGDKVILTGNPLRKLSSPNSSHFAKASRDRQFSIPNEKLPLIYITGGSGGSHDINVLIEQSLEKLLEKYIVIHQTGDAKEFSDFDRLEKKKETFSLKLQQRYVATKFVEPDQVFGILEKADLVICRSGINTVTELLSIGKPALFIPLPYGQQNEQLTNALFVKRLGLAEIAEQKNLTSDSLLSLINTMLKNVDSYKKHSNDAKKLIDKNAAEKIITIILDGNK
jgi:UDP-N-acetylglucosamine--N-acetylmuramyl-(pentapeptide) pyrophosphoryl-undecaprenol N-acetylglucosamine transferase